MAHPPPETLPPPPPPLQQQCEVAPSHGLGGQAVAGYDPFLEPPPTIVSPEASPRPPSERRYDHRHRGGPARIPDEKRPNAAGERWHSERQRVAPAEQAPPWQPAGQGHPVSIAPPRVAPTWPPPQTPQQSPPVPLQQMHRDPHLAVPAVQPLQSRYPRGQQHDQHQAQPAPRFLGRMHRAQPVQAPGEVPMAFDTVPAQHWHQQPRDYSPRGGPAPGAYAAPQRSHPAPNWAPLEHGAQPRQQPGFIDTRSGPPHPSPQSWPQEAPHQPQWDPGQLRPPVWGTQPVPQPLLPHQHHQQRSAPAPQWGPHRGW